MKKLRNKKGEVIIGGTAFASIVIYTWIAQALIVTVAATNAEMNGNGKKNRSVVWCKMQNKDSDYCNEKYGYEPKKEVKKEKTGRTLTAFLRNKLN